MVTGRYRKPTKLLPGLLWAVLLAHFACAACSDGGQNAENLSPSPPSTALSQGLTFVQDLRLLTLPPRHTITRQVSSHARNGGNVDFSYPALYREDGMNVVLDEQGPGCINRIWITAPFIEIVGPIQIFLDRMDDPVVDMSAEDLFSGLIPPFRFPLAGDRNVSSGGYFCYVPMPFRKRCKVRIGGSLLYYNIDYYRFTEEQEAETFTGREDNTQALDLLAASGGNPHEATEEVRSTEGRVSLGPGENQVFFLEQGPGWILQLTLRPDPLTAADLSSVWLHGRWDRAGDPQLAAPLLDFFGSGLGPESVRAFPLGINAEEGEFYCYFPMPFDTEGEMRLENRGTATVDFRYRVDWSARPAWAGPGKTGTFHAQWHEENPTRADTDYRILETEGWGRYVGCTLTMHGKRTGMQARSYLEGDERAYVDDSLSPSLYGTGTEDYFNGGWYFSSGTFTLPFHGNPGYREDGDGRTATGCYRFHITDPIPFYRSLRFGIEHGGFNRQEAGYRSVAYYYARPDPALILTDFLDVGDEASERLHQYKAEGVSWTGESTFYYEGDRDGTRGGLLPIVGPPISLPPDISPESVRDDGRRIRSRSRFVVRLDPANRGVRLRRRMDAGMKDQAASVSVDGVRLSIPWHTLGWNLSKRWKDAEYEIPARYMAGKDAVALSIQVEGGDRNPWTEYTYWIYCYRDL